MNVDLLAGAGISGRDDVRLAVDDESDMADEAFVQDGVHLCLVVDAAHGVGAAPGFVRWVSVGFHCVSTIAGTLDRRKIHF